MLAKILMNYQGFIVSAFKTLDETANGDQVLTFISEDEDK